MSMKTPEKRWLTCQYTVTHGGLRNIHNRFHDMQWVRNIGIVAKRPSIFVDLEVERVQYPYEVYNQMLSNHA